MFLINRIISENQREEQQYFMTKFEFFALCSLMVYIVWQAFSGYLLHMDGAGRIPLVLISLSFVLFLRDFAVFSIYEKRAVAIWCVWIIFTFLNLYFQGSEYSIYNRPSDLYLGLLGHFMYFIVAIVMLKRKLYTTLFCILAAYSFNLLLYFSFSSWQIATGYLRYISDLINANEIGFQAVFCATLAPFFVAKYKWLLLPMSCSIGASVYLIVLTASRTSFASAIPPIIVFIALIFYCLRKNLILSAGVFLCVLVGAPAFLKIFNQTVLFQRIESREDILIGESTNPQLSKIFGERVFYIENGVEVFEEHPLVGIGYTNYADLYDYRNHVEFMAQLTDGGIIGFTLFMLFFFNVIALLVAIVKQRKWRNMAFLCFLQLLLSLILFNLGLFTTNLTPFYVMFAVLLVYGERLLKNSDCNELVELEHPLVEESSKIQAEMITPEVEA